MHILYTMITPITHSPAPIVKKSCSLFSSKTCLQSSS